MIDNSRTYNFMNKKPENVEKFIQENRELIGKQIRIIREKKGYNQDELAEIMKVNRSTISKIENGKFSVTIDYLAKFSLFLGFNILIVENEIQ